MLQRIKDGQDGFGFASFIPFFFFLSLFTFIIDREGTSQPANKIFLSIFPLIWYFCLHSETVGDWIEAQQLEWKCYRQHQRLSSPVFIEDPLFFFYTILCAVKSTFGYILSFWSFSSTRFIRRVLICHLSTRPIIPMDWAEVLHQMEQQRWYFSFSW